MIRIMVPLPTLFAALCLPLAVSAQDSVYQEQIAVEWVLVPAVVRKGPNLVLGLEQQDFELSVDGRPVAIQSFEASTDAPVSLVHLQDLSGSMALGGKIETSRGVLSCLLERARPGDEIALAGFASGKIRVEVPFTGDVEALGEAMAAWRGYGTTGLHDAVAWLPEIGIPGRGARRAALLITDGADNASELSPAQARELVRRAQLPVYVLGLDTGSPFELGSGGGKRHRYADVLNLLARLTGGRYYSIVERREVAAVCDAIDQELRSQYVLGFAAGAAGSTRFRSLQVTVPGKKVEVLHRHGYSGRLPTRETNPRP